MLVFTSLGAHRKQAPVALADSNGAHDADGWTASSLDRVVTGPRRHWAASSLGRVVTGP
ncbi:hypothetical protein ACIBG4_17200 [Nonomuraea sp. NPDC050383]|uniref:hypothetical protein n=1 Tax=Nonomuraea sp. NPDC050383 TaxID=3364362 RepID=UPI0037B8550F